MLAERPAFDGCRCAVRCAISCSSSSTTPATTSKTPCLSAGFAGVTVVHIADTAPHRDQYPDPERPILRIEAGRLQRWTSEGWQPYVDRADAMAADEANHLAPAAVALGLQPDPRRAALGGHPGRHLHHAARHSRCLASSTCRRCGRRGAANDELRVPIGVTATGEPLYLRPQGRSRRRYGSARPDDRHDRLGQVADPDVDSVVAVDNPLRRAADRHLCRLQGRGRRRHLPQLPPGRRRHLQHGREEVAGRPVRRHPAR